MLVYKGTRDAGQRIIHIMLRSTWNIQHERLPPMTTGSKTKEAPSPIPCRNLVRGVCVLTRKRCRRSAICLLSTIKEG